MGAAELSYSKTRQILYNPDLYLSNSVLSGSSWAKLPLLTVGLLGAQIVWSTEMGYGEHL